MDKKESDEILKKIFEHQARLDLTCRFKWTENAIAIWDNRCVQHHAIWDYWPEERSGHRVTAQGEKPVMWTGGTPSASTNLRLSA